MSFDPAPHEFVSSGEPDSPYQVEKLAEAADFREATNVGPDSVNPDTSTRGNLFPLVIFSSFFFRTYISLCQIFRLMISTRQVCLQTLLCSTSCMTLLRSMARCPRICFLSPYSLRIPRMVLLKVRASSRVNYRTSQFFD